MNDEEKSAMDKAKELMIKVKKLGYIVPNKGLYYYPLTSTSGVNLSTCTPSRKITNEKEGKYE